MPHAQDLSATLTQIRNQTRRHFLATGGLGIGAIAMGCLSTGYSSAQVAVQTPKNTNSSAPKPAMIPARAKRVIYLHMAGSPSQLELFGLFRRICG